VTGQNFKKKNLVDVVVGFAEKLPFLMPKMSGFNTKKHSRVMPSSQLCFIFAENSFCLNIK